MSRTGGGPWPDGRPGAVNVTFDNLGEAAELQMGLRSPDEPLGGHHSVTQCLPKVLELLAAAGLHATFFVEGLNAEVYPDALGTIVDSDHEVGYHAWRHEEWGGLSPDEQAANLGRGAAALRSIGIEPAGFRPPGGQIGERTLDLLAENGFGYCSPSGTRAGLEPGAAVLPFRWTEVDAFHILPPFESLRRHVTGSGEAGGPDGVGESLTGALERAAGGDHVTLVLHTWLIELEEDQVRDLLGRVARAAGAGEVWAARCDETARWMRDHPQDFAKKPELDRTSWISPS